jgi:hypothetical protein
MLRRDGPSSGGAQILFEMRRLCCQNAVPFCWEDEASFAVKQEDGGVAETPRSKLNP